MNLSKPWQQFCFLGIISITVVLSSCQKQGDFNQHIAIVGIPSQSTPSDWNKLQQCFDEINRLLPDETFVICDWNSLLSQLNDEQFAELQSIIKAQEKYPNQYFVPLFNIAKDQGTHLVPDKSQKRFYLVETKPSLFFVLDSRDSTVDARISERQIRWLLDHREKSEDAQVTTVLLDRPIWNVDLFPGKNTWWTRTHPVLKILGVKYVIASYQALYTMVQRDGIQYIQSAGAGDTTLDEFYRMGNFHHFLWLAISKNRSSVSPIRLGAVKNDSVATAELMRQLKKQYQAVFTHPEFILPEKPRRLLRQRVTVRMTDPMNFPLEGTLHWEVPNSNWRIYPRDVEFSLDPDEVEQYQFNVWLMSLNSINRNLPFLQTMLPPLQDYSARQVRRYLIPKRKMTINMRKHEIVIDGNLNDWYLSEPLLLNEDYLTTPMPKWSRNDLSVAVYSAWDTTGLYLGVDVKDNRLNNPYFQADIRKGDCVELGFDGSFNRTIPGFDEDDHDVGFAFNEQEGPVAWRWHGSPDLATGRTYQIPFAIQRIPAHTLYEIFLPAKELTPIQFKQNIYFGFTIAVHDDDGNGWEGAMQWTAGLIGEPYSALFGEVTLK